MLTSGQPVVVVTRTISGRDTFNNDTYSDTPTVVTGIFAPGGTTETTSGGDTVVMLPTVYLPAGTVVAPGSAVIVNPVLDSSGQPTVDGAGQIVGDRYEVDGEPSDWVSPFTSWAPGVEVRLRRTTG